MGYLRISLFIFSFLSLFNASLCQANGLGRFVGVLKNDKLKQDQLAKLDFVLTRSSSNQLELQAVLTLHFGGFDSGEYIGYDFHKVEHFLFDQSFTFDQTDQGVTIAKAKLSGDTLTGILRSEQTGNIGKLVLERDTTKVSPESPLVEPLWGEYRGKCDPYNRGAFNTAVQLYTHRSSRDLSSTKNPFAAYSISGFLAQDKGDTCIADPGSRLCVWSKFYDGSYNFFNGQLRLAGRNKNLSCQVTPKGLVCGKCELTRVSDETKEPRTVFPRTSDAFFKEKPTTGSVLGAGDIEGEYFGYLHHASQDVYQPVVVNVVTYPVAAGTGHSLRMSASANLYFGDFDSAEVLTYRFVPRTFPNPLLMGQFVFDRSEQEVDAVMRVDKIGSGKITGTWYSKIYGKIGRFLLTKDNPPEAPKSVRFIPPISGVYKGRDWNVDLSVGMGSSSLSTSTDTENPFFQLLFSGKAVFAPMGGPARTITGGGYDFYTGKIGIEIEDGKRVFVGSRSIDGQLRLKAISRGMLSSLPTHALESYFRADK